MTLTEWRDHLEILGPDLAAWPPRLADEGMTLLARSEAAQDLFAKASGACGHAQDAKSSVPDRAIRWRRFSGT